MTMLGKKKQLALYIHIPFCSKKCRYCSFYTLPGSYVSDSAYCDAIIQEWFRKFAPLQDSYDVDTIFFGGGTPSLVSPEQIQKIILAVGGCPREVTLEANPENLTAEYLYRLSQTKVNRISIGAQTFCDTGLKLLGRDHSSTQIIDAVYRCNQFGFFNLSLDLIYGLPHQTLANFLSDVQQAIALPITHLSLYNLTIDPHTSFYKHKKHIEPSIAADHILATMSLEAESLLKSKGFLRYELASYSKPTYASKHNLYYWTDRPFLGLGVSASQYIHNTRTQNLAHIFHYLRAIKKNLPLEQFSETLPIQERQKEALALRLRLTEGALKTDFDENLQQKFIEIPNIQDLLEETDSHYRLNARGRLFHDLVATEIMALTY